MLLLLEVVWWPNWIEGNIYKFSDIDIESVLIIYSRFRLVPTFGRSTIRRFSTNASEMKKLAARNYEDLLQVCGSTVYDVCYTLTTCNSVQFQCSTGFSLSHITKP